MTSNILPLFWDLASSSKDTRLSASTNLVGSLESFQQTYLSSKADVEPTSEDEEDDEDDEDEEDDESGVEVEGSDDEETSQANREGAKLDKKLAASNAADVAYTVKRLVRGLASSRESSRLGFAVALTELLSRITTVTSAQVLSLLMRSTPYSAGMRGPDGRDALFARLFGINSLIQSGCLYHPSSTSITFSKVVDQLIVLGQTKGWLRESAWWSLFTATEGLLKSNVPWRQEALDSTVETVFEDKRWSQEKIALALVLEQQLPNMDLKSLYSPTFKHTPLLSSGNLVALGKLLKESDIEDEEEGVASSSTGSWKPQLHFVWNTILDSYFPSSGTSSAKSGQAQFQDFFRVVVDESLFSNSSSSERKFWGFSVLTRTLPLVPSSELPFLFTPNVMRTWINNLSSPDRYLHKAALALAKQVQDSVKQNPTMGFTLLSTLVGKGGRPDFDKVTKTKTVESIMGSLTAEGVGKYAEYLMQVVVGPEQHHGADASGLEERRVWALDQLLAIFRNGAIPKQDSWVATVLDFLLLHSFFVVRKADKKSNIIALHSTPKPTLSEATAAICRSRFFSCLVEITTASFISSKATSVQQPRQQGCDAAGTLWIKRVLGTLSTLEGDKKHVEMMADADEEIKKVRKEALSTMSTVEKASTEQTEVAKGVEILLGFTLLQTYEENDDALELLEDVNTAAKGIFKISPKSKTANGDSDAPPPIDALLDVLVALLDKSSSDLRNLANVVVGMVASAFTQSSVEHLVAQLQQTVAEAAANGGEEVLDGEDDESAIEADENDEDNEEDEEDDSSSDEDDDLDESDAEAPVDPAFRQRVAEALQVSGMAVDTAVKDEDSDAEDDDEDSEDDDEAWDDDAMMKVDEQLAEVFRQRANAGKKTDFKHLHVESVHFKSRILDFFDVFARKQSTSPVILYTIVPLLKFVQTTSATEIDLSNKTSGILKTRIGKAKDVPITADLALATSVLEEIHQLARKAPTADYSAMCSACSLFVVRTIDASTSSKAKTGESDAVIDAYRATLEDYMTKKSSTVHPPFIAEFIKRFPTRAFPLVSTLTQYADPATVKKVNVYRQLQSFTLLQLFSQQLSTITKSADESSVIAYVDDSRKAVYATVEQVAMGLGDEGWNTARLKEVVKFGLHLARTSKNSLPTKFPTLWDVQQLEQIVELFQKGDKTKEMKGVQGLLTQLKAITSASSDQKKGKKAKKDDEMDVDEPETPAAAATKKSDKVKGDKKEKSSKKRKSVDGSAPVAADGEKKKKSKA